MDVCLDRTIGKRNSDINTRLHGTCCLRQWGLAQPRRGVTKPVSARLRHPDIPTCQFLHNLPRSYDVNFEKGFCLSLTMLNRRALVISGLFTFALLALYISVHRTSLLPPGFGALGHKGRFDGTWNYKRDADNLMLDSKQCEQAFPGLFEEIERPVKDRMHSHITVHELDSVPKQNGFVRAMVYNQQVGIKLSTASELTTRSFRIWSLTCLPIRWI